MKQEDSPVEAPDPMGVLGQVVRTFRLAWRLMRDPRVPIFPKLIIPAAFIYILSPIDLLPDLILGLGQLDDVAILFFSVNFFVDLCPPDVVEEHRRALAAPSVGRSETRENVVEGSYRVLDEDDPKAR